MENKELIKLFKIYLRVRDIRSNYLHYVDSFLEYCSKNNVDPLNITYNQASDYVLELMHDQSNGSVNNYLNALRCFYAFLTESGNKLAPDEVRNIMFSFKHLPIDEKIKDYLTIQELEALVSQAITYDSSMTPEKSRALLFFMYYTGARRNEVVNLKRKDINLEEREAILRVPVKNRKENTVFFPNKVKEMLKQYFDTEPEVDNAFNLTNRKIGYFFKFLQNFEPEGKHLTPHTLRHSFANMLAQQGVDIRIAQKLLGHKSIQSTMIYYNPDKKIVKEIYRKKIR